MINTSIQKFISLRKSLLAEKTNIVNRIARIDAAIGIAPSVPLESNHAKRPTRSAISRNKGKRKGTRPGSVPVTIAVTKVQPAQPRNGASRNKNARRALPNVKPRAMTPASPVGAKTQEAVAANN